MKRREFLATPAAALGAARRPVRIGSIGVGGRGTSLLRVLLSMDDAVIQAVCDTNPDKLARAQGLVEKTGRPRPEGYGAGEEDFRRLVARDDLDAVIIATPWEWHTRMAVAAMKAGKYAAVEVPAALTLDECWELVNTPSRPACPA